MSLSPFRRVTSSNVVWTGNPLASFFQRHVPETIDGPPSIVGPAQAEKMVLPQCGFQIKGIAVFVL